MSSSITIFYCRHRPALPPSHHYLPTVPVLHLSLLSVVCVPLWEPSPPGCQKPVALPSASESSAPPRPITLAPAPPPLPPSAPPWTIGHSALPGFFKRQLHLSQTLPHLCCGLHYSPALHPFGCSKLRPPLGSASTLDCSSSTSNLQIPTFTSGGHRCSFVAAT